MSNKILVSKFNKHYNFSLAALKIKILLVPVS